MPRIQLTKTVGIITKVTELCKISSAMSSLIMTACGMHYLGIGYIRQYTPLSQDAIQQRVHILHLSTVIQDVLNSQQPATLNPLFLGVRQRHGDIGFAQRKSKGTPQLQVQFLATGKTGHRLAGDQFTFGNLHALRASA